MTKGEALLRLALREKRHPGAAGAVLRDIGLALAPGEMVALLGPSGIGKTSLLHILAGLDPQFEGQRTLSPANARVGVVFQDPLLLPWRSVRDNLLLALPRGADPAAAEAALAEVGLAGAAALWPRQLSLGMARRVALARALAIAPDILLLDEPFVSLDAATAAGLRALLGRLRQDRPKLAALLVTHDAAEAAALADRAVLLGGGPPATVVGEAIRPPDGWPGDPVVALAVALGTGEEARIRRT